MKVKVQRLMDAMLIISQIIREQRAMPQKGKYRFARLHAKLLPEFTTINDQRDAMIKAYDCLATQTLPDGTEAQVFPTSYCVPPDKIAEFTEAWGKIADDEIELDVEPIPLAYLDLGGSHDGSIEATELITLGEFIAE